MLLDGESIPEQQRNKMTFASRMESARVGIPLITSLLVFPSHLIICSLPPQGIPTASR